MNSKRKVESIVGETKTNFYYSIASFYVFPNTVLKIAKEIVPSDRGRYEITDVNKHFFEECKLQVQVLDSKCRWFDTNSIDTLLMVAEYMKKISMNVSYE